VQNPYKKARELLNGGKNWTKGTMVYRKQAMDQSADFKQAMDQPADFAYCAVGALSIALRNLGVVNTFSGARSYMGPLNEAMRELFPDFSRGASYGASVSSDLVMSFNDENDTTFEMIDQVFERAEKIWERDHA
jgi:L-ribulose-5-phosphate 3-epimerase UlaE